MTKIFGKKKLKKFNKGRQLRGMDNISHWEGSYGVTQFNSF